MSPPAQLPKRTARRGVPLGRPKQRASSSPSSAAASKSTSSKTRSVRRTSSSTSGRRGRRPAVCHHRVRCSRSAALAASRSDAPSRASSRSSRAAHAACWWSCTERRVASVGCAVSTKATSRSSSTPGPRPSSSAAASAIDSRWRRPDSASAARRRRTRSRSSAMLASWRCIAHARTCGSSRSLGTPSSARTRPARASPRPARTSAAAARQRSTVRQRPAPSCSMSTSRSVASSSAVSRWRGLSDTAEAAGSVTRITRVGYSDTLTRGLSAGPRSPRDARPRVEEGVAGSRLGVPPGGCPSG